MEKKSLNWLAFLVALVLAFGTHGAFAQPYTQEGETSVARATQGIADANGDIVKFRDMTIRWRFDVLMGSPLRQFAGRYTHYDPPWVELSGVQTCFAGRRIGAFRPLKLEPQMLTDGVLDQDLIYAHTRFNMFIQPNARLSFMITGADRYIQHAFMVDTFSTGSEYGLSVPGSPEWDRMFQYGHEGVPDNPWLTEAQAKELFAVGFTVSRIEMIEPRYALTLARASYERHFGASHCGDEPAQTVAEAEEPQDEGGEDESPARPSEPQTAEDRIAAMLTRVADAQQQAREEQARLEEEARQQEQQEIETAALVLPEGVQGEAVNPAAPTGGQSSQVPVRENLIELRDGTVLMGFDCVPQTGGPNSRACSLTLFNSAGAMPFVFQDIRTENEYFRINVGHSIESYTVENFSITKAIEDYMINDGASDLIVKKYGYYVDSSQESIDNINICANINGYQSRKLNRFRTYMINSYSVNINIDILLNEYNPGRISFGIYNAHLGCEIGGNSEYQEVL